MKKFIVFSVVLSLLAGLAFAQDESTAATGKGITVSGWGRGVFAALRAAVPDSEENSLTTGVGPGWGGKGPWVGVDINGSADAIGFKVGFNNSGDDRPGLGTASIWGKPFDWLRLEFGKFEEYSLWGKVGGGDAWADYTVGMGGEADIFTQFAANTGALISLTPVDGLYLGALLKTSSNDGAKIEDVYEKIQVGLGYEISGIGHARVQYIGEKDSYKDRKWPDPPSVPPEYPSVLPDEWSAAIDAKRVEVAFAYTGVADLTVDVGAKIYFPVEIGVVTAQKPYQASVGANYTSGDLGVKGRVDATFGGKVTTGPGDVTTGLGVRFNVIPSYNLGFATVGADLGVQLLPGTESSFTDALFPDKDGGVRFGAGAWVQKSLGSGHIKTGFAVLAPSEVNKAKTPLVFTIPVLLEYYF
jgi:hypothetical protein